MQRAGIAVLGCWAITHCAYFWIENILTGDEAFGAALVLFFWAPVLLAITAIYGLVWAVRKLLRKEFKFLLAIPAALLLAVLTGTLGFKDGHIVLRYSGQETRFAVASDQPTTSHSYERLSDKPDYWLNIREMYKEDGVRHREDGPAFNWYYDDNRPSKQEWYIHGVQHRKDGPADIEYYPDGTVKSEVWMINGRGFREDGPYRTDYFPDGMIESEKWNPKEPSTEADLPSTILYFRNGVIERKIWSTPGETWHRENGPAFIYYYEDGAVKREVWLLNSKHHREGGPAEIEYSRDGQVINEVWHVNDEEQPAPEGAIVGPNPSSVTFHSNGNYASKSWTTGGYHRLDGLAKVSFYEDGATKTEEYMKAGQLHREDGPAVISYDDMGGIVEEKWYHQGNIHRDNGPAVIRYKSNGEPRRKWWYQNGEIHRDDGPADIWYLDYGVKEEWYSLGQKITPPANGN